MTPPPMSPDELVGWLRLTLAPGIGCVTQHRLLRRFGLPAALFATPPAVLAREIGAKATDALLGHDASAAIAATADWLSAPGNHLLTLADAGYPRALLDLPDAPAVLYLRGDTRVLATPALAVVGSRAATAGGMQNAEQFSAAIARAGYAIVSGLALGIDAAAHRGALAAGGTTIAVVGTGLDRVYPARHRELAHTIGEHGLLVSELPLGSGPHPANFPRRNRIIAALARGVLVVEAARESGSLITARLAGELGREVLAIPGSIHAPQARGCHQLIRQGAKLVETADDILEELGVTPAPATPATGPTAARAADAGAGASPVLVALGHDPCALDTLAVRTGLTADALLAMLLELELDGHVAALPGGRYQRLASPLTHS